MPALFLYASLSAQLNSLFRSDKKQNPKIPKGSSDFLRNNAVDGLFAGLK